MKKSGFILILFILVLFSGCNLVFGFFQPLFGCWENSETALSFQIIGFEQKQLTPAGYTSYRGDYLTRENILTLRFDMGDENEFTYEIHDNNLYLTDNQGQNFILTKK